MFKKKSSEQQIIVEAEKVSSMKESLDALSWNRVAEIAKDLQEGVSDDERYEFGRELLAIAQANTSLLGKLGISSNSLSGQLMSSGIELLRNDAPTESFEPEEPEIFSKHKDDSDLLGGENSGEAKQAALSFLYEDELSFDQELPEVVKDVSADQTEIIEVVDADKPKSIDDTDIMEPIIEEMSHNDSQKDSRKQKTGGKKKKKKKKGREIEGYILIDELDADD